jgi:hypothetical protein
LRETESRPTSAFAIYVPSDSTIALATKRNSATLRCEPLASKPTLGPAIGQRFPYVAVSAVSIRLPLAAEGSITDDVVSDGILGFAR